MFIKHQPAKNILAPFITSLVRHPGKQNLMTKQQYTVPDFIKFLGHPVFLIFESPTEWGMGAKEFKVSFKRMLFNKKRERNEIKWNLGKIMMV